MKLNKVEQLADKLRETWNITTQQLGVRWECLNERARRGYIAVAEKAIEELSEKQYRMLEVGEVLQATDEVQPTGGVWMQIGSTHAGNKVTNTAHFPVGYYRRHATTDQQEVIEDRRVQIRDLEQKLQEQAVVQALNSTAVEELVKWEEACRARDKDIDDLIKERDALKAEQVVSMWHGAADPRLKVLVEKMERIEKATMRLRGYKEINSHDPAQCITDAASLIQRLQRQLTTVQNVSTEAVDGWNKDHMEMKRKLDAVVADKDAHIRRLMEKLDNVEGFIPLHGRLKEQERSLFEYSEFTRRVAKAVGWNDMMIIPLDRVAHLAEAIVADSKRYVQKLEKAARYINALEEDLSFYNTVTDLFKTKLESAAHGE